MDSIVFAVAKRKVAGKMAQELNDIVSFSVLLHITLLSVILLTYV